MRRAEYNIRLVHLLLEDDPDPVRQARSIEQLQELEALGIEYVQVWNRRWQEAPPRETFARPDSFDQVPIKPAHYGCFRAFADAAQQYFTTELDAIILCEGDVKLLLPPDRMIDHINRAVRATSSLGIDYFSLGSKWTLEEGILQSQTRERHGDIEVVDKIIGIQMILFPQSSRQHLLHSYANSKWDGADIFLNQNFGKDHRLGIFSQSPTSQWSGISAIEEQIRDFVGGQKILYLAPHLSTGGMPQFLLKRVEALLDEPGIELHVVEYNNYSNDFVVQRDRLATLLGDRLYRCPMGLTGEQRDARLLGLIDQIKPDIIHIEECPESFDSNNKMAANTLAKIYAPDREYQIVETCHNIWMDNSMKVWHPNSYMWCTQHHAEHNFSGAPCPGSVVEYPIELCQVHPAQKELARAQLGFQPGVVHLINIGLWTPGKNQGEGVEIARWVEQHYPGKFQFHFIGNMAPNFRQYWGPITQARLPENVKIWGERKDTHLFLQAADAFMFNSTWECNPIALREAIGYQLPTFARNLKQYGAGFTHYIHTLGDSVERSAKLIVESLLNGVEAPLPPDRELVRFKQEMLTHYQQRHQSPSVEVKLGVRVVWDRWFRLYVDRLPQGEYRAQFWDGDLLVYEAGLEEARWYQPAQHWFTPWRVKILRGDLEVWHWAWSPDQPIAVQFDSSSLGDTLAWMGQVERFQEEWSIPELSVITHKNQLWDREYYSSRGIQIVNQAPQGAHRINLGVYYSKQDPWNRAEHRMDWRKVHLGQIASDRLGIPFQERRPRLAPEFFSGEREPGSIITFATHSTAQAKYWNRPEGWSQLIASLPNHRWIHCSREGNFAGVEQAGESLVEVARLIRSSQFFVGISSGLSWFAWALGTRVYLISGFTPSVMESSEGIHTIGNTRVCNGCWAWDLFDKGDWNWCPAWKGTPRQFECSREITPEMVLTTIEQHEGILLR